MKKPLAVMAAVMLVILVSPGAHAATFTAMTTATTCNWKGTFSDQDFFPADSATELLEMTTEAVRGEEEPIPEELDVSLEKPSLPLEAEEEPLEGDHNAE